MHLRFSVRRALALATTGAALFFNATSVMANAPGDEQGGWRDGRWQDGPTDGAYQPDDDQPGNPRPDLRRADGWARDPRPQFDVPGRDAWLADCRQRVGSRDRGVGGAAIGGIVGGVAGNRIAGRGNRTVGTIAGAAVGAAAGYAIDRAEDRGANRDACEAYLDDYYARYYKNGGYRAPQYAQPRYAPVMVPAQQEPECTETIEYIYEDVPVRQKNYRPVKRTKYAPDKRIKITPDKQAYIK